MRILFITETVPYPLDTGGRIKTWHTLEALARDHEVHCHAFARNAAQRDAALGPLSTVCRGVTVHLVPRTLPREGRHLLRSVSQRLPITVTRHYAPRAMAAVAADRREHAIDVLYCDHLSMLEYGRQLDLPIVHDAHNVEHRIVQRYAEGFRRASWRTWLYAREARLLHEYERSLYPRCSLIFAVSEVDAAAIAAFAPAVPVLPVPIGFAAESTRPVEAITGSPEVLFVGAQDWPPNADAVHYFLAEIWPGIRREIAGARLTVVGRGASAARARWAGDPTVQFTGWVEDVSPWFERSRVMVVPLRSGSGMRVKILEAFARGIPVVSTRIGIEGIAATDNEHALVADSPGAFARATVAVLRDRTLAERLSKAARTLALERYDIGVVGRLQREALRGLQAAGAGEARHRRDGDCACWDHGPTPA